MSVKGIEKKPQNPPTAKPTPKTPAQVKTNNVAQKNATAHLSKLKK